MFAGEYVVVELPTLEVGSTASAHVAVNDVVVASSTLGRMVELAWAIGGEDLGDGAVRRDDLLHAVGVDRVQPLERRARCSCGASTRWR